MDPIEVHARYGAFMFNEIDNAKNIPGAAGNRSLWRRFLDAILMFESSPYFEGTHEYYEKRMSNLEHEVAQLKLAVGQADVPIQS